MAHLKGNAPRSKAFGKVLAWVGGVLAVLLVIAGIWMLVSRGFNSLGHGVGTAVVDYSLCAETAEGVELSLDKKPKAQLPLSTKCWSGWVSLPNQVDARINNGRGDLEYLFWDGRRLFVSGTERQWLGQIRGTNFRLRGEGIANIAIEPKSKPKPKTGDA